MKKITPQRAHDETEKLVKASNKVWVDYIGRCGEWNGNWGCVDVVLKNHKRPISDIWVRFMNNEFDGVAVRLADGAFRRLVSGRPGCSNQEDLGDITQEDVKALMPIYNKHYLEKYAELYRDDDEWVEDMNDIGMVGIRDDFSVMADKMDILLRWGVVGEVRKFN